MYAIRGYAKLVLLIVYINQDSYNLVVKYFNFLKNILSTLEIMYTRV
jgi:hypothetical protein